MLFAIFQTHSRTRYRGTSAIKHTYNSSIKIGHSDRFLSTTSNPGAIRKSIQKPSNLATFPRISSKDF